MENEPLMVDKVENEKEELPIWCEGCDQQGFIFVDDMQKPTFVVCSRCGFEASQVWCPKCEMGGDFVSDIEDRPIYWVCTSCMKRYSLPDNFYEEPVPLYVRENIPKDIKVKTHPVQNDPLLSKKNFPALLILFIFVVSIAMIVFPPQDSKISDYGFVLLLISLALMYIYNKLKKLKARSSKKK
jgi:hypothetical protein